MIRLLAALGLLALALAVCGGAEAIPANSCANLRVAGATTFDERQFSVWAGDNRGNGCGAGGSVPLVVEAPAGSSITFTCTEVAAGVTPPGPPDTDGIRIRAYADNLGNPAGSTFLWEHRLTSCLSTTTFTKSCTSDGTPTGAPSYGMVRLYLRAIRTSIPSYDGDTESLAQASASGHRGAYRCTPAVITFSANDPGSAFVGGDALTTTIAFDSIPYNTGALGTLRLKCGAGTGAVVTTAATISGTLTQTHRLKGSFDVFPDGCQLRQNLSVTRLSQIPGYEVLPYVTFEAGRVPADVVRQNVTTNGFTTPDGPHDIERDVGKQLQRALTAENCQARISGAPVLVVNPGEAPEIRCTWKNHRGEPTPAGRPARGYTTRTGIPDTSDIPSRDITTSPEGLSAWTATTTSTTTRTTGGAYKAGLREYDTARTDAELLNVGTSVGIFDVVSTLTLSPPTGPLACGAGPSANQRVHNRGDTVILSWRLCNARDEPVTPTVTARARDETTLALEHENLALAPAADGTYTWTYALAPADQTFHTQMGAPKQLSVLDANGNSVTASGAYGASDLLHVEAIHTWLKTCVGPEWSTFVVAADTIAQNEGPVRDMTGRIVTRPLTFTRAYMENESGASLPADAASGVTSGTSPCHVVSPQPPSSTNWAFHVRVEDAHGNHGETWKQITFISPYTGQYAIACLGTQTPTPPGGTFRITCQTQRRDPERLILAPFPSDDPPSWRLNTTSPEGDWTLVRADGPAEPNPAEPAAWWMNHTLPAAWDPKRPLILEIAANMSGAVVTQSYPLLVQEETGSDPVTISASYSWDTHRATIAIRAAYLNGTGRQGLADQLVVRLQRPDLIESALMIQVVEGGAPGSYYATPYMGLAPTLGAWTATVDAPQVTGTGRATATTTFLVPQNLTLLLLDQRDLALDTWHALNESFGYTWALLNQSRAENRDNFAYTWDLINATRGLGNESGDPEGLTISFTGDGAALQYAGRPARLEGHQNGSGPRAWYWTWDFGDKTTGQGPVAYHAWERPGTYNITARATTGSGRSNVTTFQVEVRLSSPVLNITGPRLLRVGERGTWGTGTSHDPYDEVSFSFVADPVKVRVWLLGERWMNGGFCGPLNATSLQGPDYAGIDLGPIQTQWALSTQSCTSFTTTFSKPGEHRIVLYGVNRHGVETRLDYTVHVLDLRDTLAPRQGGPLVDTPDFRPVVDEARESIHGVLDFLHWLTGG